MELAGIFGWDIDFALDIREKDSFRVLYQEQVVEGEVIGRGRIIAAIFHNQGETFTAIYDDRTDNYYDENGRAMKKPSFGHRSIFAVSVPISIHVAFTL